MPLYQSEKTGHDVVTNDPKVLVAYNDKCVSLVYSACLLWYM